MSTRTLVGQTEGCLRLANSRAALVALREQFDIGDRDTDHTVGGWQGTHNAGAPHPQAGGERWSLLGSFHELEEYR